MCEPGFLYSSNGFQMAAGRFRDGFIVVIIQVWGDNYTKVSVLICGFQWNGLISDLSFYGPKMINSVPGLGNLIIKIGGYIYHHVSAVQNYVWCSKWCTWQQLPYFAQGHFDISGLQDYLCTPKPQCWSKTLLFFMYKHFFTLFIASFIL